MLLSELLSCLQCSQTYLLSSRALLSPLHSHPTDCIHVNLRIPQKDDLDYLRGIPFFNLSIWLGGSSVLSIVNLLSSSMKLSPSYRKALRFLYGFFPHAPLSPLVAGHKLSEGRLHPKIFRTLNVFLLFTSLYNEILVIVRSGIERYSALQI
jgi:hypothetical protein